MPCHEDDDDIYDDDNVDNNDSCTEMIDQSGPYWKPYLQYRLSITPKSPDSIWPVHCTKNDDNSDDDEDDDEDDDATALALW